MRVTVADEASGLGPSEAAELERLAAAAAGEAWRRTHRTTRVTGEPAAREHEVRVRIVGDDAMAAAHQRYLGVAGTTDVITFDGADGGSAPSDTQGASAGGLAAPNREPAPLDVDLLVCLDEAERQSAARGVPRAHELLLYVLHGVLHCLGHDDHDGAGFDRMHAEEDAVLEAIGVGAVFAGRGERGGEATGGGGQDGGAER